MLAQCIAAPGIYRYCPYRPGSITCRSFLILELCLIGRIYNRNVMNPHIRLNEKSLTPATFDEWLRLFSETVDEYFEGPKAGEAKSRAKSNALLMQHKNQLLCLKKNN